MDRKEKFISIAMCILKASAYFCAYIIGQIIAGMVFSVVIRIGVLAVGGGEADINALVEQSSVELTLIANLISILLCAVLSFVFKRQGPREALKFNVDFKQKGNVLWTCVALGVFGQFAISTILVLIPFPDDWFKMLEQNSELMSSSSLGMQIFSIAIIAPIAEEIIFRGCIQDALSEKLPKWVAIVSASLVFGLMHVNPIGIIYATVLGILMGWLYSQFKSILPSMIFHVAFNLTSLLLPEAMPIILIVVSIIIFGLSVAYLIYLGSAKVQNDNNDDEQGDNNNEAL